MALPLQEEEQGQRYFARRLITALGGALHWRTKINR